MTKLKNDCLIRALLRQPTAQRPVWVMRQAGRYLPEYRALRAKVPNFIEFCQAPELAMEATLQPLRRYALDAAIIFSDILTVPVAMGMSLEFVAGQGPVFAEPIRGPQDLKRLQPITVERDLSYVMSAIRQTVTALDGSVPLIGFAGSPWTVACYMVEGQGSKQFPVIRQMLYQQPEFLQQLLMRITEITIDYLNAQIEAGARAIMLFDTWGGLLTPDNYRAFSLHYLRRIAEALKRDHNGEKIPVVFFTKGASQWLEYIADSGCDAMGLDWTINIGDAHRRVGDRVALQGNLDPLLLFAKPEKIRATVKKLLADFGDKPGHIVNLGHGIIPNTPPENVAVLVNAVHEFSEGLLKCKQD
ncbi:MAG: uroporphyrinogen decarboxylase [Gammaproteobacteria bacterium]|nr:uroporphyrinogen decarboxylase [Gammaproteobacteria bacterium]